MSDYEFYEGLEGAGDDGTHDAPDSLWPDASAGADHNATTFTYDDAEWGPTADDDPVDAGGYEDLTVTEEEPAGLLDGIAFDMSGLDLTSLSDTQFDASYDVVGASPDEQGWWTSVVSTYNHDGAYETVEFDDLYVTF